MRAQPFCRGRFRGIHRPPDFIVESKAGTGSRQDLNLHPMYQAGRISVCVYQFRHASPRRGT